MRPRHLLPVVGCACALLILPWRLVQLGSWSSNDAPIIACVGAACLGWLVAAAAGALALLAPNTPIARHRAPQLLAIGAAVTTLAGLAEVAAVCVRYSVPAGWLAVAVRQVAVPAVLGLSALAILRAPQGEEGNSPSARFGALLVALACLQLPAASFWLTDWFLSSGPSIAGLGVARLGSGLRVLGWTVVVGIASGGIPTARRVGYARSPNLWLALSVAMVGDTLQQLFGPGPTGRQLATHLALLAERLGPAVGAAGLWLAHRHGVTHRQDPSRVASGGSSGGSEE